MNQINRIFQDIPFESIQSKLLTKATFTLSKESAKLSLWGSLRPLPNCFYLTSFWHQHLMNQFEPIWGNILSICIDNLIFRSFLKWASSIAVIRPLGCDTQRCVWGKLSWLRGRFVFISPLSKLTLPPSPSFTSRLWAMIHQISDSDHTVKETSKPALTASLLSPKPTI